MLIGAAAVQVAAGLQCQGYRFHRHSGHAVVLMEIADRPAVRYEVSLEVPFIPEFCHQRPVRAAGFSVRAIVGAHHRFNPGILDQSPESRQIGLFHVLRRGNRVKAVTLRFRPAVYGKVLGARGSFEGVTLSLQAVYKRAAQRCGQVWVFAVGFVSAAPAWIPENVDVRRPHGQPVIDIPVSFCRQGVILCSRFGGDRIGDLFQQSVIEHGRHANGLWEACCRAAAGQPVQRFIPPVVCRDPEPLNGRRVKTQLPCPLFHRHAADKLFCLSAGFFTCHCCVFLPSQVYLKL